MSDSELDIDKDDFTDAVQTFSSKFKQKHSFNIGNSALRHLGFCDTENIISVNDKGSISVNNLLKTTRTWNFESKENISDLAVFENNSIICSNSSNVKLWDCRQSSTKPMMILSDTSNDKKAKYFNCLAVNSDGLVVAGTEQIKFESYLLFWDIRQSGKLQGGYWETHCDDITSVKFKPGSTSHLVTGCTDGMVNILDVSQTDEDEALETSYNASDSVASCVWYLNSKGDNDNVAIQTHTEAVQLWHTPNCAANTVLDRDAVCHGIRRTVSDYTYIAGLYASNVQGLTLVAGSRCPGHSCIRLGQIRNKKVKPMSLLEGTKSVVTSTVGVSDTCVVTGADNGILTVWSGEDTDNNCDLKIVSKKSKHRDKPY